MCNTKKIEKECWNIARINQNIVKNLLSLHISTVVWLYNITICFVAEKNWRLFLCVKLFRYNRDYHNMFRTKKYNIESFFYSTGVKNTSFSWSLFLALIYWYPLFSFKAIIDRYLYGSPRLSKVSVQWIIETSKLGLMIFKD